MIDRKVLLADLIKQVKLVEADLKKQIPAVVEVRDRLKAEHTYAFKIGRTAQGWAEWSGERATQAAVAWVLGSVFVRFCEDNGLVPEPYLAGGDSLERLALAEERQEEFLSQDAARTHRDWLLAAFEEIGSGQAGKLLFDKKHNALFQVPISHDGAKALVAFWRERSEDGSLVHDFTDPLVIDPASGVPTGWDTRFLGDLYQDLSESARKTYALLQTPEFVEEFILDRTLNKAIDEFGYAEIKMIDPTCGSGHFVLGTFQRLFALWTKEQGHRDAHERVRFAMDAVHGVDINPFAVAVARFRLLVAGMAAAGMRTLAQAGKYDWPIHLAIGDSLIKSRQLEITLLGEESGDPLAEFAYATEDIHEEKFKEILNEGQYHVVVGNPPYITVKDKKLNDIYRDLYKSCAGKYSLSIPFAERFFQLSRSGGINGRGFGFVGQITANSFMKREFGKKLIEEYFSHKVELTEVIDTSGVYVPGNGTPDVILIGRRRSGESRTPTIRTVRGIQGEPSIPRDPQNGLVWRSIRDQIELPGSTSAWVSVDDLDRKRHFGKHPWILVDGGLELVEKINENSTSRLRDSTEAIGFAAITGDDDAYVFPHPGASWFSERLVRLRPFIEGDQVRDWGLRPASDAIYPIGASAQERLEMEQRALWANRTILRRTLYFGQVKEERGMPWSDYAFYKEDRLNSSNLIAFSEMVTHNHFVASQSQAVFNRSSPVIKLKETLTEGDRLRLLCLLNSSTACFWLKMMCYNKGSGADSSGARQTSIPFEDFYAINSSNVEKYPIISFSDITATTELEQLSILLEESSPAAVISLESDPPSRESLRVAMERWEEIRARMITLQEESDWQVYAIYGLHPTDLRLSDQADIPTINLGERAFEIVLARRNAAGEASKEWFTRHNSTAITELPTHWSDKYKEVVESRISAIASSRAINLIERPEYKRRWQTEGWRALEHAALRSWLLNRLEKSSFWFEIDVNGNDQPRIQSLSALISGLSEDEDFVSVAALFEPRNTLADIVGMLLADEHVPFLPSLRYKPGGLAKRQQWEDVWTLQRAEDSAPDEPAKRAIRDTIPVPPKYTSADFVKPSYWKARGKLDVHKERFISYADQLGTPTLFGWAGWDHQQQAQALAIHIMDQQQNHAATKEQLTPLLAGLLELQPWLTQWHNEFDANYGGSPAAFFEGFRINLQGEYGLTDDGLLNWRPAPAARARGGRNPKVKPEVEQPTLTDDETDEN